MGFSDSMDFNGDNYSGFTWQNIGENQAFYVMIECDSQQYIVAIISNSQWFHMKTVHHLITCMFSGYCSFQQAICVLPENCHAVVSFVAGQFNLQYCT